MEDIAKGAGVCLVVLVLSIHCSSQGPWSSESQISFSSYWPHTGHRLVCSLKISTDGEHLRHSVPLYSVQGIVGDGDCMVASCSLVASQRSCSSSKTLCWFSCIHLIIEWCLLPLTFCLCTATITSTLEGRQAGCLFWGSSNLHLHCGSRSWSWVDCRTIPTQQYITVSARHYPCRSNARLQWFCEHWLCCFWLPVHCKHH